MADEPSFFDFAGPVCPHAGPPYRSTNAGLHCWLALSVC